MATLAPAPHAAVNPIDAAILGGPQAWLPIMEGAAQFLANLALGAGMLVVTFWVAGWAARLARRAAGRLHGRHPDAVLQGFVGSLARYVVITIGVIAVLEQLGVRTTSVLAVLGAASLAVGLALQGGLSNVAAGLMILILRPYRVGDRVCIAGVVGRVHGLDLFVTRLQDLDNSAVFIPNSKAFGDVMINYSLPENRRIAMDFHIDYADDVDLALEVLRETARADARIVDNPAPWAKVTELGDSAVTITLRAWTSPVGYRDTRFDLIKDAKAALQAAGLTFAYPRQVAVETRPWTPPDTQRQQAELAKRRKTAPRAAAGPSKPKRATREARGAASASEKR